MAAQSLSAISTALSEAFDAGSTDDILAKEHPLLGLIEHNKNFNEKQLRVSVKYANPGGGSPDFTKAKANQTNAEATGFVVTRKNFYQFATVEGELLEMASAGSTDGAIDKIVDSVEDTMTETTKKIAFAAYRSGGGAIGQVVSGTASPVTLTPDAVDQLEKGMKLRANDTNDSTSLRTGTATITHIDYNTCQVTYTGTITDLAVGDFIIIDGYESASPDGFLGWCPTDAPSATTFYGVDRSVNSRLGGTRIDCSDMAPEEIWANATKRMRRNPVKVDAWLMHPEDIAKQEVSLASCKIAEMKDRTYNFGYDTYMIHGAKIVSDSDAVIGTACGVPFKHFTLASLGDAPRILNEDGLTLSRSSDADAYEVRCGARYNFYSDAPGMLVNVKLPA